MSIQYLKCQYCGLEKLTRPCSMKQHENRCSKNPNSELFLKLKTLICPNCKKEFLQKYSEQKFCCKECAWTYSDNKSHPRSLEQKQKVSKSLKLYWSCHPRSLEQKQKVSKSLKLYWSCHPRKRKEQKFLVCKDCGKKLCYTNVTGYCYDCSKHHRKITDEGREKLINAGKKSAAIQRNIRRSKNEIYFADLIHSQFSDSINNTPMFNGWDADIVIPSLKIAILWNGKWHYEDIMGGLNQIQNRDKIKYNEIVKAGYMPYIIVDLKKFSKTKCENELKRFNEFLKIIC